MTSVLHEGRRNVEWILSAYDLVYSTDEMQVDAVATHQSGTLLGVTTATGVAVPWNPALAGDAQDGSQVLAGILYRQIDGDSTLAAGSSVKAAVVTRGPVEASSSNGRIPYPAGYTFAQVKAALAALGGGGIVLRD
jgi:hypothetical protein